MNNYQVRVSRQGNFCRESTVVASDALSAINQVEASYKKAKVQLVDGQKIQLVEWTGFEFEARLIKEEDFEYSEEILPAPK